MTRYVRPSFAVPFVVFSGRSQKACEFKGGGGKRVPGVPTVRSIISETYSPLSVSRSVARYRRTPVITSRDEEIASRTLTTVVPKGVTLLTILGLLSSIS